MQTIHVERTLNATADFVFDRLAEHADYDQFPGVKSAELLEAGSPDKNGVGAVRRIAGGPFVLDEVIERYEPGAALGYKIIRSRPLPIRHKVGLITIEATGAQQCQVVWHSEFAIVFPLLGGWLSRTFQQRMHRGFMAILKNIEQRYQPDNGFALLIDRSDLHQHKLADETPRALQSGEVRMAVDRFALTANNITYAVLGDDLSYWNFFPAAEGWGKLPVWGFADVVESNCEGVEAGERFYGYYPFASELVVQPAKLNEYGFMDGTQHRRELPSVYNHYVRVANDPMYAPERENLQAIFRPLFTTSFLLDVFLAEEDYFGADTLILSSASSKTAISCAFLMNHFRNDRRDYKIIGLTSAGNVEFVEGLGCYDQVVDYSAIQSLDKTRAALFIDFAGNADLTRQIHAHYADQLQYSSVAGVSHWEDRGQNEALPGPKPDFFFAPDHATRRVAQWGQTGFGQRLGLATQAFFGFIADRIEIQEFPELDEAQQLFDDLLNGRMDPKAGYIVRLGSD